ncbi:antA/AntB antirepressor family protein [Clostridium botulinum]|uniref:antA/AntB antirepressor family protein n=1 Tax=Clostridium botulinum TaxID=1491 RepID=UPI0019671509|nr:antA/AntB antirepressor family protein [Clostridium botulinum]
MKTIQRNKIKFKIFEEDELKYQLGMCENDSQIVLKFQDKFPELLQDELEGFIIDARKLYATLEVKRHFTDWIKPYIKENNSYMFTESVDFISFHTDVNPTNGVPIINYKFTIDMAKELCMLSKMNNGFMCRKYFIIMEKTLRRYEKWYNTRQPEKKKATDMKHEIKNWCERNNFDSTLEIFYTREFNMLNENLTGYKASDLKSYYNCKTGITRDYLEEKVNSALLFLEEFNIQLLLADINFKDRSNMINNVCNNKYKDLYIKK